MLIKENLIDATTLVHELVVAMCNRADCENRASKIGSDQPSPAINRDGWSRRRVSNPADAFF